MTRTLLEERLAASDLRERPRALVRASLRGVDALDAALQGDELGEETPESSAPSPSDVYLSRIEVSGFRGIGDPVMLDLAPKIGLTIVTGRNGSGKSSLAEAVEWAFTGTTRRLDTLSQDWKTGLRNLHSDASTRATLHLVTSDGESRVERHLSASETRDTLTVDGMVTERFAPRWHDALENHRPFLPHDELEKILTGPPSRMFDAFAGVLGVSEILDAAKRAGVKATRLKASATEVQALRKALMAEADQLDGAQAAEVAELLRRRVTSPDAARERDRRLTALVTQVDTTAATAPLRSIVLASSPTSEEFEAAASELDAALAGQSQMASEAMVRAVADAALLTEAVSHFDAQGAGTCPVCETGSLDETWRVRAARRAGDLTTLVAAYRAAQERVAAARRRVASLLERSRLSAQHDAGFGLRASANVAREVERLMHTPADLHLVGEHLRSVGTAFVVALRGLNAEAAEMLDELEQPWRKLAQKLAAWLEQSAQGARDAELRADLESAKQWLQETATHLQKERIQSVLQHAQRYWAQMRHESDIELTGLVPSGSGNARKLSIDASVGGVQSSPLAVMSQGELNALALSLFLPRAQMKASPFRFVVIDDPVKAMDPAKVSGLLETLRQYARSRQVVVFTHDERLVNLVRRRGIDATVVEVVRGRGSDVSVGPVVPPVERYLKEAGEASRAQDIPEALRAQVALTFCREAIEAAAADCYWRRQASSEAQAEADLRFAQARRFRDRLALAMFGDASRAGDVEAFLRRRTDIEPGIVQKCNGAAHGRAAELRTVPHTIAQAREFAGWLASHAG